ncbi:RNA polymerase sigma factor SigX [Gracilibacillus boraciitolerans JCM 21714]|uniref:RNA polymerase sigma factor n=1 Tax=Gracilibacillus boraciitolerans JCM 21714 TaxID=1298598 RepID=W4VDN6_9BACI|nr:sigma-70 family RNA polymerase sigma factor [Gracilibacillus boraciitolerans]GAE91327.1 RNA polymerase sigma factor SigX [Gracilibacillus boraciitolerans JCM 21714]
MKTTFEHFYDKYHQDLFQFIFYMVKDKEQTEDIVQDVYIKVLKSYESFKGESTEKTWLFSIARHETFDYFRKLKRKRNRFLEFFNWGGEEGEQLKSTLAEPEQSVLLNDQMKHIYHCMEHCSIDQKQILILRYIQEFTIQESAEILGWSISKVKTTQHRALKILQQCVQSTKREEDDDDKP